MSEFINTAQKITRYATEEFLGGPKIIKFSSVINFQKGATLFWVLALMFYYDNFSTQAWVYLGLHGSYGLCWLLKDKVFPDPKWEVPVTFAGAFLAIALVLGPYWAISWMLISPVLGEAHTGANWAWMTIAIFSHTLGVAIMMTADAQKFFTLKYKRGLITTGMFRFIRHPNYLGEMMIYASYAIVCWYWVSWAIILWVWIGFFAVNIAGKEISMSRYSEWADYKKKSWYLIPGIF